MMKNKETQDRARASLHICKKKRNTCVYVCSLHTETKLSLSKFDLDDPNLKLLNDIFKYKFNFLTRLKNKNLF